MRAYASRASKREKTSNHPSEPGKMEFYLKSADMSKILRFLTETTLP
jgi:hypothetical protein